MNKEFNNKKVSNEQDIKEHMFINTPNINPEKLRNAVFDFKRNKKVDIKWAELFEHPESDQNDEKNASGYVFNCLVLFEKYFNQHLSETEKNIKLSDTTDYFAVTPIKVLTGYETEIVTSKSADTLKDVQSRKCHKTFDDFDNIFCLKHKSGRLYAFFDKENKPLSIDELGIGTTMIHPTDPPQYLANINSDLTISGFWEKIINSVLVKIESIKLVVVKTYQFDPRLVYQDLGGFIKLPISIRKKTPEEMASLSSEEFKLLNEILYDENSFQETNTIRKDLNLYREEFSRLDSQKVFLDKVIELLNSTNDTENMSLKNFLESNTANFWGNRDFLNSVSDTYTTILTKKIIIEEKIDKLVDLVKRFGYYLAKEDKNIEIKELNKEKEVKKGHIYRIQPMQGTYTQSLPGASFNYSDLFPLIGFPFKNESPILNIEKIFRPTAVSGLVPGLGDLIGSSAALGGVIGGAVGGVGGIIPGILGGLLGPDSTPGSQIINIPYDDYIEVSFNNDPIQEEINRLKDLGKEIHLIQKKEDEFYNQNGMPLSVVMKNCEENEAYRRKCVIVVPFYEQILSDYNYELGANFYSNPLPGLIPTKLPEISFLEDLTYKLDWFGTEIGELVDSINLAPGETRNITLSAKFTETRTNSDSYKSISDLNITTTNDLSTEFQDEISRNVVKNDSFGGSAGFQMAGFDASVNGSTSTTITDFSKQFAKIAKKASENISKRLTTEINSSRTTNIQIDESSSRTSTISNVNQGRTLNLFIYKLYNKYYSGIYLNKLQASLSSSVELVYGSGLYNRSVYNLTDGEVIIFFRQLRNYLYFFPKYVEQNILEKISKFLREDLEGYTGTDEENNKADNEAIIFPILYSNKKSLADESELGKLLDMIENISYQGKNLRMEEIVLPSGAYYIDSMVGLNPSTEEYSEKMRDLERLKKTEEVEKINNENNLIKAKTRLLEKDIAFINKISNIEADKTISDKFLGLTLVHFSKSVLPRKKAFNLMSNSFDNDWKVFIGDRYIPEAKVETSSDGYFAKIFWVDNVPDIAELKSFFTMINKNLELKFVADE